MLSHFRLGDTIEEKEPKCVLESKIERWEATAERKKNYALHLASKKEKGTRSMHTTILGLLSIICGRKPASVPGTCNTPRERKRVRKEGGNERTCMVNPLGREVYSAPHPQPVPAIQELQERSSRLPKNASTFQVRVPHCPANRPYQSRAVALEEVISHRHCSQHSTMKSHMNRL